MLFKGGTSLSKVYNVIERFSEDIDLSLDRHDLGFSGDRDPENAPSKKARSKLLDELKQECTRYLADQLLGEVAADFESVLGPSGMGWALELDPGDDQTVLFRYPSAMNEAPMTYVRPIVRMEFGARSDFWPATDAEVRPYVHDEFPDVMADPVARVRVLEAKRTFWEKATILHSEFHRPDRTRSADRLSRHYYDLAQLAKSPVRAEALGDIDLLLEVAHHKEFFFFIGWARYDQARPGTLRLVPQADLERLLQVDYRRMADMFFGEQPPLDGVLEILRQLEEEINRMG